MFPISLYASEDVMI